MKFFTKKPEENITNLSRKFGYLLMPSRGEEFNCIRTVGNMRYPRFHLFIKESKDSLFFNLHLDQKKPSYAGTSAHSGEYEGEVVEKEAERIKKILQELVRK